MPQINGHYYQIKRVTTGKCTGEVYTVIEFETLEECLRAIDKRDTMVADGESVMF